ncbi:hypothetical protein D1BOALGB6SA_647 [Olavius sp. associated proteobacterium Delta 1]|nr:hypothetical protein D1BOALGB6SA_647 [Olavius sp. associated proteobacterium Delta 1]
MIKHNFLLAIFLKIVFLYIDEEFSESFFIVNMDFRVRKPNILLLNS